jgi:hypothetical protein
MSKIFKVSCEYYIKAKDIEEVENFVKDEAGLDFFEKHIIVEEEQEDIAEVDENLT